MGVRKFRSVEQMPSRPNRPRLDPENLRLALGLASLAGSLNPIRLVPGVGKYKSRDEAIAARARPIPARAERASLIDGHRRLEALVRSAIPEGVTYRARLTSEEQVKAGDFSPAPHGIRQPQIVIYREHMSVPGDLLHETITLAHELGHFRSFQAGLRTAEYEDAIGVPGEQWPELPKTARMAVLEEERRAWLLARELLADIGFSAWDAFWDRHREALSDYRDRLQLDCSPSRESGRPA